jgi:hypothetical protein
VLLDGVLELLPSWLELADGDSMAPRFVDRRDGGGWRLLTGGRGLLGATAERREALGALLDHRADRIWWPEVYLPVREVALEPFLLAERVLLEAGEPRFFLLNIGEEASREAEARGARLPTEAEWEFAWHQLRGVPGWLVGEHELCADGWTPSMAGLGEDGASVPGPPSVIRRASGDPGDLEHVLPARLPLASVRLACVRLALDVPDVEA